MTKKRQELLEDLKLERITYINGWRLRIQTEMLITDEMFEQMDDIYLGHFLAANMEKLRWKMFEYLAEMQRIINKYEEANKKTEKGG